MNIWWLATYLLFSFIVFGFVAIIIYIKMKYKKTLIYWEVWGDTNKDGYSINKMRKNKVAWNKNKTKWILLYPLLKKKIIIPPFSNDVIYANNNLYAFKINEEYVPAKFSLTNLTKELFPAPTFTKEWHMSQLENNEKEFSKQGFWEKNKNYIVMILTVAICCALCGITIWYTYKFAGGGREDITLLAKAIEGVQHYGGAAPT